MRYQKGSGVKQFYMHCMEVLRDHPWVVKNGAHGIPLQVCSSENCNRQGG